MDVDWNAEVLDQLESHWHGQLRPRLEGLTDEEFHWQPVPGCLSLSPGASGALTMDAPPPTGPTPVTTIAWRLAHLLDVFGPPSAPHFTPRESEVEADATDYPGTAHATLRRLDEAHDAWVVDVRALGTAGLAEPQGALSPPAFADAPIARLVMYTHLEAIHHGAEVCLLRDLYLWREHATRQLVPDQWRALRDLRLRALADAPDAFSSVLADARVKSDAQWQEQAAGPSLTIVASQDGQDVAMGGVIVPPGAATASIWGMWTAPEARGKGHGGRVLARLLTWCRERHLPVELEVTEGNATARALYLAHGFVPTGHWSPLRDGSPLRVESMRLDAP